MNDKISVTLVISTYNWPKALELVFKSILNLRVFPDEIIIADDGSDQRTKSIIEEFKQQIEVPVKHLWQEDLGFRKTIIMNRAISSAYGNYIIQILFCILDLLLTISKKLKMDIISKEADQCCQQTSQTQ